MSLTSEEKELVYIGASISAGCRPCANYHIKKALDLKIQNHEIINATNITIALLDSSKSSMHDLVLSILKESSINGYDIVDVAPSRIEELISISSAFVINSTLILKKHISAARSLGISEKDIQTVLDSALMIKNQAQKHVDKIADGVRDVVASISGEEADTDSMRDNNSENEAEERINSC